MFDPNAAARRRGSGMGRLPLLKGCGCPESSAPPPAKREEALEPGGGGSIAKDVAALVFCPWPWPADGTERGAMTTSRRRPTA